MIKKCLKCGEIKKIKAKGLCDRCYTKQLELPIIICSSCGEKKKQYVKGLCLKCYTKKRTSNIIICKGCGLKKPYFALEMCNSCYEKQRKQPVIKCKTCGKTTNKHRKGLCYNCYEKERNVSRPKKICKMCGEMKPHKAKGLCHKCYEKTKPRKLSKICICKECGEKKPHKAFGLCKTCYNNQWNQKHGIIKKPLRKSCSNYLGVHVAERVLSKVFKDVKQMPYHNPGYDFKCNKGMKVDVKSSTLHKKKSWEFNIKNNTIADYFLCIAFDNVDELNPIHIWFIPGEIVNKKGTLIMGSRTIPLYYKYEKRIDNIIKCCNKMKS